MRTYTQRIIAAVLLLVVICVGVNFAVESQKLTPPMQKYNHDLGQSASSIGQLEGRMEGVVTELTTQTDLFSQRDTNTEGRRNSFRSFFYVLSLMNGICLLFGMSAFAISFLDITGFYSRTREILMYIHRSDGKKRYNSLFL